MKIFFRNIHLYLSLVAGLVVLTTCFTGAVLVFEDELQHAFGKHRYYVAESGKPLPISVLIKAVKAKEPKADINSIKIYTTANNSVELGFTKGKGKQQLGKDSGKEKKTGEAQPPKPEGKKGGQENNNRVTAFVNPYTGEVLEIYSYKESFFYTMMSLHRWLLSGDIGKMIVGSCSFIFLFIIGTGIVLWWPKTKNVLVQQLQVKWGVGWKRLNHDLHIVLGFYSAIFLFVFAFTGLAWSFQWFNDGIYKVTNSPLKPAKPPVSTYVAGGQKIGIDTIASIAQQHFTEAVFYNINLPKDSIEAVSIALLSKNAAHGTATDVVYIDQYSGQKIGRLLYSERSLGARVRSTFKPVHIGSIFGLPSKVIAFITCLFGVSFPITGVIMWLNRIKKKKKTAL